MGRMSGRVDSLHAEFWGAIDMCRPDAEQRLHALIAAERTEARAEALFEVAAVIEAQISRGTTDLDIAARQVRLVLAGLARQAADA